METLQDRPPPVKQTFTVAEAAAMLGISPWQAYELIKRGDFPVRTLKLGRRVVVPRQPLLDVLGVAG